ncbi:MAG: hypothetical protein JXR97_04955, partial [Planctomycetes bacterium]|nr:hypothetical protein [Planctomycetota bacterium]
RGEERSDEGQSPYEIRIRERMREDKSPQSRQRRKASPNFSGIWEYAPKTPDFLRPQFRKIYDQNYVRNT